jgi:hypothetical protein
MEMTQSFTVLSPHSPRSSDENEFKRLSEKHDGLAAFCYGFAQPIPADSAKSTFCFPPRRKLKETKNGKTVEMLILTFALGETSKVELEKWVVFSFSIFFPFAPFATIKITIDAYSFDTKAQAQQSHQIHFNTKLALADFPFSSSFSFHPTRRLIWGRRSTVNPMLIE